MPSDDTAFRKLEIRVLTAALRCDHVSSKVQTNISEKHTVSIFRAKKVMFIMRTKKESGEP
jgi:hypothetical protein